MAKKRGTFGGCSCVFLLAVAAVSVAGLGKRADTLAPTTGTTPVNVAVPGDGVGDCPPKYGTLDLAPVPVSERPKTEHVQSYTRKDGTPVRAYNRKAR